jgi:hypothetical protein
MGGRAEVLMALSSGPGTVLLVELGAISTIEFPNAEKEKENVHYHPSHASRTGSAEGPAAESRHGLHG